MRIGKVFWNIENWEAEYSKRCFTILLDRIKVYKTEIIGEFAEIVCECINFEDHDLGTYTFLPNLHSDILPIYDVKFQGYDLYFNQRDQKRLKLN